MSRLAVWEALQHPVESEEDLKLLLAVLATAKRACRIGNFLMQVDSSWECQECGEPLPGLTALD
ncbi:hypothetical protein [Deinococcus radiophilus]|uniref:Uncharacterized protein n=1 Tax=Deinococcus radiophilus TaxID=32062 RepID=A0A3S0K8P5_9DEIO|nr:hypothetical protein [Deinococcus radiophilus]RTR25188.1 hypothetical protein EJ104_12040 [Deinococcus radiophilus]UFA50808.1 hypothetical protein LMT64_02555 [Deinococcus radiophilus]